MAARGEVHLSDQPPSSKINQHLPIILKMFAEGRVNPSNNMQQRRVPMPAFKTQQTMTRRDTAAIKELPAIQLATLR